MITLSTGQAGGFLHWLACAKWFLPKTMPMIEARELFERKRDETQQKNIG